MTRLVNFWYSLIHRLFLSPLEIHHSRIQELEKRNQVSLKIVDSDLDLMLCNPCLWLVMVPRRVGKFFGIVSLTQKITVLACISNLFFDVTRKLAVDLQIQFSVFHVSIAMYRFQYYRFYLFFISQKKYFKYLITHLSHLLLYTGK